MLIINFVDIGNGRSDVNDIFGFYNTNLTTVNLAPYHYQLARTWPTFISSTISHHTYHTHTIGTIVLPSDDESAELRIYCGWKWEPGGSDDDDDLEATLSAISNIHSEKLFNLAMFKFTTFLSASSILLLSSAASPVFIRIYEESSQELVPNNSQRNMSTIPLKSWH